jgi:hypothetical protein
MSAATDDRDLPDSGSDRKVGPLSALPCQDGQQLSRPAEVDEDLWSSLMEPHRTRYEARSRDPLLTPSQVAYARARAKRLSESYIGRAFDCGKAGKRVRCGCGPAIMTYGCRQHLVCAACRIRRAKKQGARIYKALAAAHHEAERGTLAVLVTISVRHTGDIGQDRRDLVAGWRRFYKSLHRQIGAFKYIGVHEITPGRDGLGHPHAHVVCLWPHLDWSKLSAMWRDACPQSTRINFQASYSVRGAAKYISKYVSKGVETSDFSPELRARAVAGTYGSRWLFTSVRIWLPYEHVCPCCKQPITRDIVTEWLATDVPDNPIDWGPPDWVREPDIVNQLAIQAIP